VLINYDGNYYALDNLCPHRKAPLCNGKVENSALVCPRHGAHFDLKTGKGLPGPHRADIDSYAVQISGDNILLSE